MASESTIAQHDYSHRPDGTVPRACYHQYGRRMDIHDIPDYPALEQLANALWKAGKARGAAVLVGAGFSRNAERLHGNTREPPLWTDIARVMQARIYTKDGPPKAP